jgi:hypothetical protein
MIALVVATVAALGAGARRSGSAVDRFAAATELAELRIFAGEEPSAELLAQLRADDRIVSVERGDVVLVAPGVTAGPYAQMVVGASDDSLGGFGRPLVVAGRYPTPSAPDEIVVNERGADTLGLAVGDRVPMLASPCLDGVCEQIPIGDATIVGVVRLGVDLQRDPTTELITLAGPSFAEGRWGQGVRPGIILSIRLADGVDPSTVGGELSTVVGGLGDVGDSLGELATPIRAAEMQADALSLAAAVTGLVGIALIAQAAARHLQRRPTDAAVLMALGIGRRERAMAAAASIMPAVLAGTTVGVALAGLVSPVFPLGATRLAEPQPGYRFDAVVHVATGVAAVLVAGLLVGAAAVRWARAEPAPAQARRSLVAALVGGLRLRPPAATGARFALDRGTGQERLPVAPTLVTVTAVVALVVGAAVVSANLDRLFGEPGRFGQPWALGVGIDLDDDAAIRRLADDPRVAAADVARNGEVDLSPVDGATTQVTAVGIDGVGGSTHLVLLDGRAPAGIEEVAVADETMSAHNLDIGDRVGIAGPCGKRSVEVVGRAIMPLLGLGDPGHGVVMPLATFDALCAEQLTAEIDRIGGALLLLHDDADAGALRAELEAEGAFVDFRSIPADVTSLRDVRAVPLAVAAIVAVFGVVALGHVLILAVRRRRHELAVLRALGWRPAEASSTIRWQAGTIAALALVVGIPAGIVIGRTLWVAIAEPIHVLPDVAVPSNAIVIIVVALQLVALALASIPARRASRLRPAQVLRSE